MGDKRKHCGLCGSCFEPKTAWQKFCSPNCHSKAQWARRKKEKIFERFCRQCGMKFPTSSYKNNNNRWHCSEICAAKSARESRSKFYQKNPDKKKEYYTRSQNKIGSDGNLKRFYKRFPDAPKACQSCGETRVVDIAHRPEHKRNGAWRSVKNTTLEKIWILCPTCHALLDRMHYNPSDIGLS